MSSSEEEDDFPSIESVTPQSKIDTIYQSKTEKVGIGKHEDEVVVKPGKKSGKEKEKKGELVEKHDVSDDECEVLEEVKPVKKSVKDKKRKGNVVDEDEVNAKSNDKIAKKKGKKEKRKGRMSSSGRRLRQRSSTRRLANLIATQMAAILPTLVNQLNTIYNTQQANANPPTCTYKNFKKFNSCNPPKFKGTEGARGLLEWFEGIESAFFYSDCPENLKVRYATSMLQKHALTWWICEKRTRGMEVALVLTWEELKEIMTKVYCPWSEMRKLEAEFNLTYTWYHTWSQ